MLLEPLTVSTATGTPKGAFESHKKEGYKVYALFELQILTSL